MVLRGSGGIGFASARYVPAAAPRRLWPHAGVFLAVLSRGRMGIAANRRKLCTALRWRAWLRWKC